MDTKGLNENHQRRLISTFQHVDKLLTETATLLTSAGSRSPFTQHVFDATPVQCKVIEDYITRARSSMEQFLESQGIPLDKPTISVVWSARINLNFAHIAISELDPECMRGYGILPKASATELEELIAELQGLIQKMTNYLGQRLGQDPQARLARLEHTQDEVRLLKELERMIRDHGLVEYRSTISMLIDRLESPHFEVAVFGRVSSGKSSLLNYFLKRELLPIGVTPITAIPIRILYGEAPSAVIHFAEGHKEQVDLLRLPEFASEQQNPGNSRHVTQIRVEIPEQYLKQGVIFVDTPGMGSLAASGAAETLAYLPRCDLGVVLIDAASSLNQEDLAVLRMLYESGAQVIVLLSKSDLLTLEERRKAADYIRQNITAQTGGTFPVFPVSVMGSSRQLADQWFEGGLIPLLEKQQEAASASLRRKVGALRDAITATLQNLLDSQHPSFLPDRTEGKRTLRQIQKLGMDQIQSALIQCEEMARELESASDLIFQETAGGLSENWRKIKVKEIDVSEPLAETCLRQVSSLGSKVAACLNQMKEQLAGSLREIGSISSQSAQQMEDWPGISGLPMFDPAPIRRSFRVRRPLAYFFGQQVLHSWLREMMQKEYGAQLYEMMHQYRKRLESWSRESLSEISRYFETKMEFYKAGLSASNRSVSTQMGETDLAIKTDLRILSEWAVEPIVPNKVS